MTAAEVARQLARHPNCRALLKLHGVQDPCLGLTLDLSDERVTGLLLVRLHNESRWVETSKHDGTNMVWANGLDAWISSPCLGAVVGQALLKLWHYDGAHLGHWQHLILDTLADAKGPLSIERIAELRGVALQPVRDAMRLLNERRLVRRVDGKGLRADVRRDTWTATSTGLDALFQLEQAGRVPGKKRGDL